LPLRLSPIQLRTLELTTIRINVFWADGTPVERSNIYFRNVLYPHGGETEPQIDDGVAEFTLPKSFEFCESFRGVRWGHVIELRESKPEQKL
jgi:hypothetical protein